MGAKGWGLIAKEDIKRGDFVIEYMGEVLDVPAVQWRLEQYSQRGITNNIIRHPLYSVIYHMWLFM